MTFSEPRIKALFESEFVTTGVKWVESGSKSFSYSIPAIVIYFREVEVCLVPSFTSVMSLFLQTFLDSSSVRVSFKDTLNW